MYYTVSSPFNIIGMLLNSITTRPEARNVTAEIGGATAAAGIILSLLSIVLCVYFVRYHNNICRRHKRIRQVPPLMEKKIFDQLVLRFETERYHQT